MMRPLAIAAFLLGVAALLAIVLQAGAAQVLAAMGAVGWGVAPVLAIRIALVSMMGSAWFALAPAACHPRVVPFVWARLVRDSAAECLPLSQLGGYVFGARALAIGGAGVDGAFAAASTVVDVTLELVAQLLYLAAGLVLLHALRPHLPLVHALATGMVVLGAGVAVFLGLQTRAGGLAGRVARVLQPRWPSLAEATARVLRALAGVHAGRSRQVAAVALHLAAWVGNGLEAWAILALMGHAVAVRDALVIDSLLYGLRSFAFMVPNALGVQEAGYVLFGGLFGLDAQTCLALSLLRRARDLVLGVPTLLAWQVVEGRRLRRRGDPALIESSSIPG